jgi:hypothetical protein
MPPVVCRSTPGPYIFEASSFDHGNLVRRPEPELEKTLVMNDGTNVFESAIYWNRAATGDHWPSYSWASSATDRRSPTRRAPAHMSNEPTRCRERRNRGEWSLSRTLVCPRVGYVLRRSSCLALPRARSNSGCIGCSLGIQRERKGSIDEGCHNGRDGAARQWPEGVGGAMGARLGARCGSAQQSAVTRGTSGAQHRLVTVRRVDLHVHLLSARVGFIMKTYRHENGECFERKRNESAPQSVCGVGETGPTLGSSHRSLATVREVTPRRRSRPTSVVRWAS